MKIKSKILILIAIIVTIFWLAIIPISLVFAMYEMKCELIKKPSSFFKDFIRCENEEVICYSNDNGLQCTLKFSARNKL